METGSLSFEKRKHPRIKVTMPVEFKIVNETEEAEPVIEQKKSFKFGDSKNISSEGMFLMTERILDRGDILKLEMKLPDEEKIIKAFAEIVWVSDHGMPENKHGAGLFFMALRDEDADRIGGFVANMLKQS